MGFIVEVRCFLHEHFYLAHEVQSLKRWDRQRPASNLVNSKGMTDTRQTSMQSAVLCVPMPVYGIDDGPLLLLLLLLVGFCYGPFGQM